MTILPPGFQFYPSDEELVSHFLYLKSTNQLDFFIPTLNLSHYSPWELDGKALQGGRQYWYFFSRLTQKRATGSGYWDEEGEDEVVSSSGVLGIKKRFVFYFGEERDGVKTSWVMNEYHLCEGSSSSRCTGSSKKRGGHPRIDCSKWVICEVHDSSYDSQVRVSDDGVELSCLDEAFMSVDDDADDISWPN